MNEPWKDHGVEAAPGRTLTVRELAAGWASHVSRFVEELDAAEMRDYWGVEDFVAALCLRDFLAQAMSDLPVDERSALASALSPADTAFRSLTAPDPSRVG